MRKRQWMSGIAIAALCAGTAILLPVRAFAAEAASSGPATSAPDDAAWNAAMRAMNEHRWLDAVHQFDLVLAVHGSSRTESAFYWKAYSLAKVARVQVAAEVCDQLRAHFPASTWNSDCRSLSLVDAPAESTAPPEPAGSAGADTDLKMLALNSLIHQDPARAMPILRDMLKGDPPVGLKEQALFVLSQTHSSESDAMLHDAASGKMGRQTQLLAIRAAGVFQGQRENDFLQSIYESTHDVEIKQAVLNAFFISNDAARMVALARAEKNLEMKREIVSQLALMKDKVATDYMLELLK